MKSKFRTKYEPRSVSVKFDPSKKLTDPQYLPDCSVDGVLKRYGAIPVPDSPSFGCDCTQFGDMSECMQKVQDGIDKFMELPSHIRERFGSDPRAFYSWISDPVNVREAVSLGLMVECKDEKTEKELLQEIVNGVTAKAVNQSEG